MANPSYERITAIDRDTTEGDGKATLTIGTFRYITTSCGHRHECNPTFTYNIGETMPCYQCEVL